MNAFERLKLAAGQDASIMTTREEAHNHPGNDAKYLDSLGLEKRHLKKLERSGLAFRAYTKNFFGWGDVFSDGSPVVGELFQCPVWKKEPYVDERGYDRVRKTPAFETRLARPYRGRGSRVKWLLVST